MTNTAYSIDWLTVTFPFSIEGFWPKSLAIESNALTEDIPSRRPYNQAASVGDVRLYWHDEHEEFKVMAVIDGQSLSKLRSRNIGDEDLQNWINRHGGKITRVDFAIDIFDAEAFAPDVFYAWECDQLATPSKSVNLFLNGKKGTDGATVYIGSRQSERMVRVYDKGSQQGTKLDWTRVEVELKGARAEQVLNATRGLPPKALGLSILAEIVEWSDVSWLENLWLDEYEEIDIDKIGRPETNTEKWVREVCIPAVERAAKSGMKGVESALRGIIRDIDENGVHGP